VSLALCSGSFVSARFSLYIYSMYLAPPPLSTSFMSVREV